MTESNNPYQAPEPVQENPADSDRFQILRKFRQETHALGALWIFGGAVSVFVGGRALFLSQAMTNRIVPGVAGVVFLVLGVATLFKQEWSLYAGLMLCGCGVAAAIYWFNLYLSVNWFNLCLLVIPLIVGLQAARAVQYARKLQAAGIELTDQPE